MKYRKKPVIVEAIQWDGMNLHPIEDDFVGRVLAVTTRDELIIETLEGAMKAAVGDWIIRGVRGEFYPCKPDVFAQTYEKVEA